MKIELEELTPQNYAAALEIDRSDIGEEFVDTAQTLMELTDYGVRHNCMGHTFLAKRDGSYVGLILLGEAIPWETDPPEMTRQPFYRLMGFVIDRKVRGQGIGKAVMEAAIRQVYADFGVRPIALGCHKDNPRAAAFYLRNGFVRTQYSEGEDIYYLRYPQSK